MTEEVKMGGDVELAEAIRVCREANLRLWAGSPKSASWADLARCHDLVIEAAERSRLGVAPAATAEMVLAGVEVLDRLMVAVPHPPARTGLVRQVWAAMIGARGVK